MQTTLLYSKGKMLHTDLDRVAENSMVWRSSGRLANMAFNVTENPCIKGYIKGCIKTWGSMSNQTKIYT